MRKLWLILLLVFIAESSAAIKCGFPCQTDYSGRGLITTRSWAADSLKLKFTRWMTNHYEESGSLARIKFDSPNTQYTVSEGIGYGMLIMVYFSNSTKSYQAQFDKLWAYYKQYSTNGLMNWKVNGFSNVDQTGAATDADLDAATALIMAYYQFGTASYLADAKTLIGNIKNYELNGNLLKPGNAWDDYKNPSYVSPAAFDKFGAATSATSTWSAVKTANYALLTSNQHATTGLFSDWCTASGTPDKSNSTWGTADLFYYDAVRVPWRLAWGYFWNGDATAQTLNNKLGSYMMSSTSNNPTAFRSGYYRSTGAIIENYASSSFLGSLTLATATNKTAANQKFLDSGFVRLMKMGPSYNPEKYFNATLQLLTGLMIAGFFPDLSLATPGHTPVYSSSLAASSSSVKVVSSSSVKASSSGTSSTGTSSTVASSSATVISSSGSSLKVSGFSLWGTYVDDYGISTVSPLPGDDPVVSDGTNTFAMATMLKGPNASPYPFVGMTLQLDPDGAPVDLSAVTGISLTYKATSNVRMALMQTNVSGGGAEYGIELTSSPTTWSTVTIPVSSLAQPDWAASASWTRNLDMAHTTMVKWEVVQGSVADESNVSAVVAISSISFNGWTPPIATIPFLRQVFQHIALTAQDGVINYQISQAGMGRIEVRDLMGHLVATPVNGWMDSGAHSVHTSMLARGVYIVRILHGGSMQATRMAVR